MGSIRLLVVDDAPFIREVVRHLVTLTDIEWVGEAADGDEAILMAREKKPTVILMDIVMPKKSGIEATKEILKEMPEVRIIACSTTDQESVVVQALEAGCCDYVVKPFKSKQLIECIQSVTKKTMKEH